MDRVAMTVAQLQAASRSIGKALDNLADTLPAGAEAVDVESTLGEIAKRADNARRSFAGEFDA